MTGVQAALHAWVVASTGLDASKVIWAAQEGGRPTGAYVSMRFMAIRPIGVDVVARIDHSADTPAPAAGSEIERKVCGTRELVLSLQCFGGAAVGDVAPVSRLARVVAAAHLPSRRAAFRAARIGFLGAGPIQSLDGVLGHSFEPRAVLDVRLSVVAEASEFGTYIESVELLNQLTGETTEEQIP